MVLDESKGRGDQWARFVQIMQSRNISPKMLMQHPGAPHDLTSQDITQFKQPKGKRPRFSHLPWLSEALGEDPSFLAREMGMVPVVPEADLRSQIEAAQRLADMEKQIVALESATYVGAAEIIASIVARANETGRWAVAVWPAVEGPDECKMHVADRIDFERTDGQPGFVEDLEADLGDLLEKANAIRSLVKPRWSQDPTDGLAWTIQTALETRTPRVHSAYPGVRSVCVLANTVTSWASDTASNIAFVLGYGLDSTRSLKVRLHGGARSKKSGEKIGEDVAAKRAEIHGSLLLEPRPRQVWYHFGHSVRGIPFFPDASSWPQGLFVIRMRETDQLLKWAYRQKTRDEYVKVLRSRDAADEALTALPTDRAVSIDVDHPLTDEGEELPESERRNRRRLQALESAAESLRLMLKHGLISPSAMEARIRSLVGPESTANERAIGYWMKEKGHLTD